MLQLKSPSETTLSGLCYNQPSGWTGVLAKDCCLRVLSFPALFTLESLWARAWSPPVCQDRSIVTIPNDFLFILGRLVRGPVHPSRASSYYELVDQMNRTEPIVFHSAALSKLQTQKQLPHLGRGTKRRSPSKGRHRLNRPVAGPLD
jgi:hypothetical protein